MDVPTTPTAHAAHDELLLAAFAAGDDLAPAEAARATTLAAECADCAAVVSDIRDLMAATAALPAPSRTRDFRLTDADAARLRPAGWRGLVAAFGDARLAFTRPLAAGLVTIGFAGLLVTVAPSVLAPAGGSPTLSMAEAPMPAAAGSLPAVELAAPDASPVPDAGANAAGGGMLQTVPGQSVGTDGSLPPGGAAGPQDGEDAATGAERATGDASPAPKAGDAALAPTAEPVPSVAAYAVAAEAPAGSGPSPAMALAALSVALVALGVLLFALRAAGRRALAP